VNWFQNIVKSERMAPLVEMLPTNFFPVVPPLLEPESAPESEVEVDPDPESEIVPDPELELEEDEEPAPEPDPELEDEPALASVDPELDVEGVAASLSTLESAPVPPVPSSLDGFELDDPQATRTDRRAIGNRRGWAARFINGAVAASGVTRHENRRPSSPDGISTGQPLR
jgi:hypothetical protein